MNIYETPIPTWADRITYLSYSIGLNHEGIKKFFVKKYGIDPDDYEIICEMVDTLNSRGEL